MVKDIEKMKETDTNPYHSFTEGSDEKKELLQALTETKQLFDSIPKGIQMVIIPNELIAEGYPVLQMHPNDYNKYAEKFKQNGN